jgi:D-alanyl-lipoteichoic acid acyltransferase DltB (MBOAT superfamily)
MSLSSWLRDYVFLPLGGAFRSRGRAYLNLMITMLVAGLWHGASWMFVLWGFYFGLLLVGHRVVQSPLNRVRRRLHLRGRLWRATEVAFTFSLVSAGWLIFRAESLRQLASAFHNDIFAGTVDWRAFLTAVLPLAVLTILIDTLSGKEADPRLLRGSRLPWWSKPVLVALTAYAVFILGVQTKSFVYAQF